MLQWRLTGCLAAAIAVLPAAAQTAAQQAPGIVRGFLLSSEPDRLAERFTVRSNGNEFVFRRNCLTWIERDDQRIAFRDLQSGEHIEVVCDRNDPLPHYARTIRVISPAKRKEILRYTDETFRLRRNPLEFMAPRGDLIFSGVVAELLGASLNLHTRREGLKRIYLRPDTRYLEDGSPVTFADLTPYTHVFIRASRNLDNEIEAYQIIWGRILDPK